MEQKQGLNALFGQLTLLCSAKAVCLYNRD